MLSATFVRCRIVGQQGACDAMRCFSVSPREMRCFARLRTNPTGGACGLKTPCPSHPGGRRPHVSQVFSCGRTTEACVEVRPISSGGLKAAQLIGLTWALWTLIGDRASSSEHPSEPWRQDRRNISGAHELLKRRVGIADADALLPIWGSLAGIVSGNPLRVMSRMV
jgi:hypothetical protein